MKIRHRKSGSIDKPVMQAVALCLSLLLPLSTYAIDTKPLTIAAIEVTTHSKEKVSKRPPEKRSFAEARITLSDHTQWHWIATCACCTTRLDKWSSGDQIEFLYQRTSTKSPHVVHFANLSRRPNYLASVALIEGEENLLKIQGKQSLSVSEKITLTDGSQWLLGWGYLAETQSWQRGDPIVVLLDSRSARLPVGNPATYHLWNAKQQAEASAEKIDSP